MKLLVGGSRTFIDEELLREELNKLRKKFNIILIISGGVRGADFLAKKYAFENKIPYKEYLPDWNKYGRKAGIIRNIEMIDKCDKAIFFWDGKSPGTRQAIEYSKKKGKLLNVIFFNQLW